MAKKHEHLLKNIGFVAELDITDPDAGLLQRQWERASDNGSPVNKNTVKAKHDIQKRKRDGRTDSPEPNELQIIFAWFRLANLVKLIPQTGLIGFMDGLAISKLKPATQTGGSFFNSVLQLKLIPLLFSYSIQ